MIVPVLKAAQDPRLLGGVVSWWPKQVELLSVLDGPQRIHVWAISRQAGKSSLAAAAAVHNATLRDDLDEMVPRGRTRYVLVACPAEGQAREFVGLCGAFVDSSPLLAPLATVKADQIRFALPSGAKTAVRAMPANSRSVRGLSASLIVLDQFAHFGDTAGPASDERMFAALEPSTRVFGEKARVLIISTPFGETGKFHEIFCAARDGLLPSAHAVHVPVWEVDTSLGEEWRQARRAELGEDVFARSMAPSSSLAAASFSTCATWYLRMVLPARRTASAGSLAWTPAFHNDAHGVALVGESVYERGVLVVGVVDAIAPGGRLRSLESRRAREDPTLARVWELIEPYHPRVVSDQHQSDAVTSFFGRKGVSVKVVNLTAPLQTRAFTSTRTRLVDGSLRCWRHPQLVQELRRVRARDTETVELPRFGGSHCDAASALALATWEHRGVSDRPPQRVHVPTGRTITGDLLSGPPGDLPTPARRRDPDRRTFATPPPGFYGRGSIMHQEF